MKEEPVSVPKVKRFRSPPYPMFDLVQAVERASSMHEKSHQHFVGAETLAEAWGLKSVDGKLWRAAAALMQYGLLIDSGSGKSRKFKVSDVAMRIILDNNPDSEKRKAALKKAALTPMIYRELWEKFKDAEGLADSIIRTHLTVDRSDAGEAPYSSSAAEEVLSRYRASLAFAGLVDDDQFPQKNEQEDETPTSPPEEQEIAVGDLIKWTSNGVDQFTAEKVEWISEDSRFLRVESSKTGIPLKEVEKATLPLGIGGQKPILGAGAEGHDSGKSDTSAKKITAHVVGGRLEITANVDAKEIDALQKMLSKYKEILEMLD